MGRNTGEAEGPSPSSLVWPLLLSERGSDELVSAMEKGTPDAGDKGMKKGLPSQGTGREVSDDTAHQISTGRSVCLFSYFVTVFRI